MAIAFIFMSVLIVLSLSVNVIQGVNNYRLKEINFVRQTAPAGQFPVSECWFSSSDSCRLYGNQDVGFH
ncbi:putative DNA-binding transcriptional regulator, DEOR-type domain protein [Escherichia coli 1-182-04_S4_C3]|nr:putative DNA-binding transcriptional regulator, DEOR-type domain protein [Escherichia coli 1-182-04_S4_C3]